MIMGQVGVLTRNPGWYGRIVQWFTGSPAYHCVIAVSMTECVSAETPVIRLRPLTHFEGVLWTEVEFPDPDGPVAAAWFALRQIGKPYAYWDIVLLVVARVLKERTPTRILVRVQERTQWFCSELADAALQAGGVALFPDRPPQTVTPADFLVHVQSAESPQDVTRRPSSANHSQIENG